MAEIRQCPHGFHHPPGSHSCDGCWCEGERDRAEYGWAHDTSPRRVVRPTYGGGVEPTAAERAELRALLEQVDRG